MGIPLWRHHPYNPDNWKKDKAKSETEPAAATQPRSIIRRATVRDPRSSATRRRQRNIDASFEEFGRGIRRHVAEANAETSRPETRHGEQDEHSLLDDFPPLRRMPGRMFRTRTLRSPPPPPPPATSRQLPPWRGHVDRSNGLGDRERSWSPGEDHWQMELSTLEPLDITPAIIADTGLAHAIDQTTAPEIEESEARAILTRLRQCADRITHVFESLRTRTANARLSTTGNEALETLRLRLATLEETEERLNELESYFDLCKSRLEGLRTGSIQSDEPSTQGFLVHAMPALHHLLEDLDNMSNNFDSIWSTPQSGSTPASPVRPTVTSIATDASAPSSNQPHNRLLIGIQRLWPSILQITHQCREMHEHLKSYPETFRWPTVEGQYWTTFGTTTSGVEELLADANIMSHRASILMNTITRPMTDNDIAAMESELAMHRQQLETFKTRLESLKASRLEVAEQANRIRLEMFRTATLMTSGPGT